MQPIQRTEISRRSPHLFSATEVAEFIGADLETINEWLEVGAIDRAVFGGGRFSKYELQRAALTFEIVKLGLAPACARDVVWEMEYDLQQIWGETISKQYQAYAIAPSLCLTGNSPPAGRMVHSMCAGSPQARLRMRAEALLDRPRATGVHVERSSGALHDLLRDHDLLDALEAW